MLLTAIGWIIGAPDVEFVLHGARVDAQVELATGAWLARAWNDGVLLASLQLDAHGDLVEHLRGRLLQRLRLAVLFEAVVTRGQLEEEQHGRHDAVLEGILGVLAVFDFSAIRLLQGAEHMTVLVRREDELRVLAESAVCFRGLLDGQTSTAGGLPFRVEAHGGPLVGEVVHDEDTIVDISPAGVVDHESSVHFTQLKSLIFLKLVDILLKLCLKLVYLLTVVGPFAFPLAAAPWISDPEKTMCLTRVFHLLVMHLEDVVKSVSVARQDSCVNTIDSDSVLCATSDRTAH